MKTVTLVGLLAASSAFAQEPEPQGNAAPMDPAVIPTDATAPETLAPKERAADAPSATEAEAAHPTPPTGFLDKWLTFARGELARLSADNPYGATFQLPKGYVKFGYKWTSLHGDSRFDGNGKLGPVIPPLQFQLGGKPELSVDFGVSGHGGSHTFSFGYGITDRVSWFIDIPFNYLSVQTDLKVNAIDDQGNHIGPTAAGLLGVTDRKAYGPANFLYQTLPQLGRPVLGTSFRGTWLLGDTDTGVAWNFYRSARFSSAVTGHVFLPTAHIPSAEHDILYATGTEIEVGTGGWGLGAGQGYDVRLVNAKWFTLVAGGEIAIAYHFPQQRAYPTNFVKPQPAAAGLSPAAFPDLSGLAGNFTFTPGWGLGGGIRLDASVAIVGVSVGYSIRYNQKPKIDGDPFFIGMVDSLGLLGETEIHTLAVVGGLSLIPLAIPGRITFGWQRVLYGRNVLLYQDQYTLGIEGYIPTTFFMRK